jgi:hypothetical protein
VARALMDLGRRLLGVAAADIATVTHDRVKLTRWAPERRVRSVPEPW